MLAVLTASMSEAKRKSPRAEAMGSAKFAEQDAKYGIIADEHLKRFAGRVACRPFSAGGGAWVLATFAPKASMCGRWESKNLIRLADFSALEEGVLCNYVGEQCKPRSELEGAALAYLDELRKYHKPPVGKGCEPITDWQTYLIQTAPAANGYGCGANRAATHAYDLFTATVTFLDGRGKKVGWVPLPEERIAAIIAEFRARWGVTQ